MDKFSCFIGERSSSSFSVYVNASILLKTMMLGLPFGSISDRVFSTTCIWSSNCGCEISTTCTQISASRTSSSVDLNDSTRPCGSLRMKPTVSVKRKGRLSITTFLTVVSSVANNLFSANTSDLLIRFIMVDLPTLV